jgi:hypothetical protein
MMEQDPLGTEDSEEEWAPADAVAEHLAPEVDFGVVSVLVLIALRISIPILKTLFKPRNMSLNSRSNGLKKN